MPALASIPRIVLWLAIIGLLIVVGQRVLARLSARAGV